MATALRDRRRTTKIEPDAGRRATTIEDVACGRRFRRLMRVSRAPLYRNCSRAYFMPATIFWLCQKPGQQLGLFPRRSPRGDRRDAGRLCQQRGRLACAGPRCRRASWAASTPMTKRPTLLRKRRAHVPAARAHLGLAESRGVGRRGRRRARRPQRRHARAGGWPRARAARASRMRPSTAATSTGCWPAAPVGRVRAAAGARRSPRRSRRERDRGLPGATPEAQPAPHHPAQGQAAPADRRADRGERARPSAACCSLARSRSSSCRRAARSS